MLVASLFIIKKGKQPNAHPLVYSRILTLHKRKEVPVHATTWPSFKNMMLNERCQKSKIAQYRVPFICNVQSRKSHRDKIDQ